MKVIDRIPSLTEIMGWLRGIFSGFSHSRPSVITSAEPELSADAPEILKKDVYGATTSDLIHPNDGTEEPAYTGGSRETKQLPAHVTTTTPVRRRRHEHGLEAEAAKRDRKPNLDPQTLAELLDDIELTFDSLAIASDDEPRPYLGTKAHASTVRSLKLLGPYIPPHNWEPAVYDYENTVISNIEKAKFAGAIFIALNQGRDSDEHWNRADFYFALRLPKMPPGVRPLPGICYCCGTAWRVGKRLIWSTHYCAIDPTTGIVTAATQLARRHVRLPGRHGGSYTQTIFTEPKGEFVTFANGDPERAVNPAAKFAHYFSWGQRIDSMWSVSVRRASQRLTFCIDPNKAVAFFKDRGLSTGSRRRRPILHLVEAHTRLVDGKERKIKQHVRGAEKFEWRGFQCAISAPKFHFFGGVTEYGDKHALLDSSVDPEHARLLRPGAMEKWIAEQEDNNQKTGPLLRNKKKYSRWKKQILAEANVEILKPDQVRALIAEHSDSDLEIAKALAEYKGGRLN